VSAWHGVALWTARGSGPRERVCTHKHRTEVGAMDCALVFIRRQIGRALHGGSSRGSRPVRPVQRVRQEGAAVMVALISYQSSGGVQGRCDAKCYEAQEEACDCICGGRNHGAGLEQATDNTRELAQSWIEHARADGQDVAHVELAVTALHQPLFSIGDAK